MKDDVRLRKKLAATREADAKHMAHIRTLAKAENLHPAAFLNKLEKLALKEGVSGGRNDFQHTRAKWDL